MVKLILFIQPATSSLVGGFYSYTAGRRSSGDIEERPREGKEVENAVNKSLEQELRTVDLDNNQLVVVIKKHITIEHGDIQEGKTLEWYGEGTYLHGSLPWRECRAFPFDDGLSYEWETEGFVRTELEPGKMTFFRKRRKVTSMEVAYKGTKFSVVKTDAPILVVCGTPEPASKWSATSPDMKGGEGGTVYRGWAKCSGYKMESLKVKTLPEPEKKSVWGKYLRMR